MQSPRRQGCRSDTKQITDRQMSVRLLVTPSTGSRARTVSTPDRRGREAAAPTETELARGGTIHGLRPHETRALKQTDGHRFQPSGGHPME